MTKNIILENLKSYACIVFIVGFSTLLYSCAASSPSTDSSFEILNRISNPETIEAVKGGRLYDMWWEEIDGATEPETTHPLWKLQSTNTRKGSATWRCKECHGWDYRGKDGAYKTGSHRTGFPGILNAQNLPLNDIDSILRGSTHPDHDFSNVLNDNSIRRLVVFIKKALVDLKTHIDHENLKPVSANAENGLRLYIVTKCSHCHGEKGMNLNFGSIGEKKYVGTAANSDPWEFIHKVRFGDAGEIMPSLYIELKLPEEGKRMPSGTQIGYRMQDILDILEYSRSLPTE